MKLSLMKEVFKTVSADWDCRFASELVKGWDHDRNWIKMWRASANFICFLRNNTRDYVARFNSGAERKLSSLEGEINLINYLSSRDISVARPVLSNNHRYIEEAATSLGTFYTSVFDRITGERKDIRDMKNRHFYAWGKALGRLHKVCREIPKNMPIIRPSHEDIFEMFAEKFPGEDTAEVEAIKDIRCFLKSLEKNKNSYGIIHYDFELDNIIWNDEALSIIDFDDSLYSWFIADIAHALRDLTDEGKNLDFSDIRLIKFLDGYKDENGICPEELEKFPDFYRLHHFISCKRLERSIDLQPSSDNPEWMNALIKKLTETRNSMREGFINNL